MYRKEAQLPVDSVPFEVHVAHIDRRPGLKPEIDSSPKIAPLLPLYLIPASSAALNIRRVAVHIAYRRRTERNGSRSRRGAYPDRPVGEFSLGGEDGSYSHSRRGLSSAYPRRNAIGRCV